MVCGYFLLFSSVSFVVKFPALAGFSHHVEEILSVINSCYIVAKKKGSKQSKYQLDEVLNNNYRQYFGSL